VRIRAFAPSRHADPWAKESASDEPEWNIGTVEPMQLDGEESGARRGS
jgi:hypothetical protein